MEKLCKYGWLLPAATVVAAFFVFVGLFGGDAPRLVRCSACVVLSATGAQLAAVVLMVRRRNFRMLPFVCFGLLLSGGCAWLVVFWNWSRIWA